MTAQPQAECVNAPAATDGCKTFAAQDGYETRIECSQPSHCGGGERCCANRQYTSNGSFYDTVTCAAACNWPDVILCDGPSFPCPVVQTQNGPAQTTCKPSQLLPPGYLVCGT